MFLFKRFRLTPEEGVKRLKKIQKVLTQDCKVPNLIMNHLKNNDPKPYPSITPMTMKNMDHHVLCVRCFDVSMLMFSVYQCNCCGVTIPLHRDTFSPKDAPFDRKHLNETFFKAWHCQCDKYCKGSQFFSHKKGSSIKIYRDNHDGLSPWEYLSRDKKDPNAVLCNKCHLEITSRNSVDLQFARSLSFRNGFGPIYRYPDAHNEENINITRGRRLQTLLRSLTCAEEAAIRQITPLVSLVRLSAGSIGMKGNTSCV